MKSNNLITPLLIRSPGGRSGTSLMMEILSSSENILFDKRHPYEVRMLSYFYRQSMLMFSEKDPSWKNDLLVTGDFKAIGPIPVKTNLLQDEKDFSNKHFIKTWESFSESIATNKSNKLLYYAEKIPHDILDNVNDLLQCKVIYLTRDPRSELNSIINFNKKRNTDSFGWKNTDDLNTFSDRFINQRKKYFDMVKNAAIKDNTLVIKYEDLISNVKITCKELSAFIGLNVNEKCVIENKDHMTAKSPKASLSQWKYDLPNDVIENINHSLIKNSGLYTL